MKKYMISQPIDGCTKEEIFSTRKKAEEYIESIGGEVINRYFSEEFKNIDLTNVKNIPVYLLHKSIEVMSNCDAVYFCKDWSKSKECCAEQLIAALYGIETVYEYDIKGGE